MIALLRGRLIHKDAQGVIVDCGGVGYGAAMSVSSLTKLGAENSEVELLIHTHVGQDVLRLFAFADAEEKATFEVLIGTSGVGPKLALAILSTLSSAELREVVAAGDKGMLTKIPGVGGKKAERLLLELRDRLPIERGAHLATASDLFSDLVSALVNLGFKEALADRAARQAMKENEDETDPSVLVREALKLTTR